MIELSRVGLGTNNFGRRLDLESSRAVVETALSVGITHVDTADVYGSGDSERFIGEILEGRRGDAVVATKFGGGNGSPDYVRRAIDASLDRLRADYVDLFYYHRPGVPYFPLASGLLTGNTAAASPRPQAHGSCPWDRAQRGERARRQSR